VVEGFVSGKHKSPFKGFSVEFAEHRQYAPGDDLRNLDWRVLGRKDRYYIKQYIEETNLRATLLLDASGSMAYAGDAAAPRSGKPCSKLLYRTHRRRCSHLLWASGRGRVVDLTRSCAPTCPGAAGQPGAAILETSRRPRGGETAGRHLSRPRRAHPAARVVVNLSDPSTSRSAGSGVQTTSANRATGAAVPRVAKERPSRSTFTKFRDGGMRTAPIDPRTIRAPTWSG
jgi:uncharacterized protein (DUF58 family)